MKLTEIYPQIKTDKVQVRKKLDIAATDVATLSPSRGTDRVELSSAGVEVQRMKGIINQTPDVRTERVQALKGMIERGEYQVDPRKVADKMLKSLLQENVS